MSTSRFYLTSSHFPKSNFSDLKIKKCIGKKAEGLLDLPQNLVPPFIVISYKLFEKWLISKRNAEDIIKLILPKIISEFENLEVGSFIVRSSAADETFDDRGYFDSSIGNITKGDLYKTILTTLKQNHEAHATSFSRMALIIQQYVKPKLYGHLSNERRVSRNKPDWLIEIVSDKGDFDTSKRVSNKGVQNKTEVKLKPCKNKKDVIAFLTNITKCAFLNMRHHIEWVWDGQRIWIVQNDLENESYLGTPPGYAWKKIQNIIEDHPKFTILKTVMETKKSWKKIECVKSFKANNLPFGDIFILEDEIILEELATGKFHSKLKEDLEQILKHPIVIRMDINRGDGYENILLPRTETLFTIDQTRNFLITNSKNFVSQNVSAVAFCFLIHRFIISKACALAFAVPNKPKARIDSTWGIVDGLYYHPHDSFEVNLIDNSIKKLIRCKTDYLDTDDKGNWTSKKSGTEWDWAESLNKNQLVEITRYTTILSNNLKTPAVVMYFVDVNPNTGYPPILPWFFTQEEVTSKSEKSTDVIFSQLIETIKNRQDMSVLALKIGQNELKKITVKINLNPDLLRDKDLIEEIGLFARNNNVVIELEGSILSHAYYILRKAGATVKCVNLFEPKYRRQKFYKLVRDNIPVNIESKGEKVRTAKIDSSELLEFLKEKAVEEAFEFYWENEDDRIVEELADILEILRSSCKIFGISIKDLEVIADKKNEKKGGFEKGIFLMETTEAPLIEITETIPGSLFEEEKHEKRSAGIESKIKRKQKKVNKEREDIIYIPYAISKTKSNKDLRSQFIFGDRLVEIMHMYKGIQIKLLPDAPPSNPNQLTLNFEDNSS